MGILEILGPKKTIGAWFQLGSLQIFGLVSDYPFSYLVIDHEHGSRDNIEKFPIYKKTNQKLLLRTSSRDVTFYSWVLDIGYDGIILANVKSSHDIHNLLSGTNYGPRGLRGLGYSFANLYSKSISNYDKFTPLIGIQVESVSGLNCFDEILNLYSDNIDFAMLGPYDLSLDIGCPGDFSSEKYQLYEKRFLSICGKNSLKKGIHIVKYSHEGLLKAIDENYDIYFISTDSRLLVENLNNIFL
jgi:2-keto-3-deoxy-L-rhamnonate aldolase RhmA